MSTVIETNHHEAVWESRAERIVPHKRNDSAMVTRPSFGTVIQ